MHQDIGVDVVDRMPIRRISCFIAPKIIFGASCGQEGI